MTARAGAGAPRRGLTIVEVLVAILLLGVGLLALAGLAAAASETIRGGRDQIIAAAVAQSRFDSLSSIACGTLATTNATVGSATTRGVQERWVVTDGSDVKRLADTLRIPGRTRPVVYSSVIPCRD